MIDYTLDAASVETGNACAVWCQVGGEQIGDVRHGIAVEARDEGVDVSVRLDFGGVDVEPPVPDQARLLTAVDDLLEEALEDVDPKPLPNAGEAGVVGQVLVQRIAQILAVRQVQTRRRDELALGSNAFEEHHQLQLEEDDRVDGGSAPLDTINSSVCCGPPHVAPLGSLGPLYRIGWGREIATLLGKHFGHVLPSSLRRQRGGEGFSPCPPRRGASPAIRRGPPPSTQSHS